ncbi:DUF2919 domain-containing protein [Idiomarina tyrosinivorans]|uniref:DUF2919 domain-containing protein n=1 Tax=Idiomarina tyrosinivorans TaxID=1445662 RepID=A0A432ZLF1_9GAMM|nr:DUF2919 family protein [Idiomarina tyrosinivorans]RUO78827.1 DUF2919 domain-containing protein [Idiomarina tyrosinivorans]
MSQPTFSTFRYRRGDGQLQLPNGILLVVAFLLRGYIAWAISLTFSEDRTRLLGLFFATEEQFLLAVLVGLPALLAMLVITLVREDKPNFWNRLMRWIQPLLVFSLLLDAVLLSWLTLVQFHGHFSVPRALLLFSWCWALWYCLNSRHWRVYRTAMASAVNETRSSTADS